MHVAAFYWVKIHSHVSVASASSEMHGQQFHPSLTIRVDTHKLSCLWCHWGGQQPLYSPDVQHRLKCHHALRGCTLRIYSGRKNSIKLVLCGKVMCIHPWFIMSSAVCCTESFLPKPPAHLPLPPASSPSCYIHQHRAHKPPCPMCEWLALSPRHTAPAQMMQQY